jgi:hypothetical protein
MTSSDQPFWIDYEYDRDYASPGPSRFAVYVQDAAPTFEPWTDESRQVELAAWAWNVATPPVMAPGFVRYHRRIASASLARSNWDASLVAQVELVTSPPAALDGLLDWGSPWHDWPVETWGDGPRWLEPSSQDLAARYYMLTTVRLQFTIPHDGLPAVPPDGAPPLTPAQLVAESRHAVQVVVSELNKVVAPVIAKLEDTNA